MACRPLQDAQFPSLRLTAGAFLYLEGEEFRTSACLEGAMNTTPTYRLESRARSPRVVSTPMEWRARGSRLRPGYGSPTEANLEAFVQKMNASMDPGGVNAHLGCAHHIVSAKIVRQSDGKVMATYEAPAFQVI